MPDTTSKYTFALTQFETHFPRMAENGPILVWYTDSSGTRFYFNKPWCFLTGRDNPVADIEWLDEIHPEDREAFRGAFLKNFSGRTPFRSEYRLRRRDGSYRWIFSHAAPLFEQDGMFVGFLSSSFDHTEQREFETTLAVRALKQSALANFGRFALAPRSFSELTREAVRIIVDTLHVDCAMLLAVDHETHGLTLEKIVCRLGKTHPHDFGAATPEILAIKNPVLLAEQPALYPAATLLMANGIRSGLACPIGTGKELHGFLLANARSPRGFSDEAFEFIEGLANTLTTFKQRDRAEKALAESEQKLLQSQKVEAIGLLAGGIAHDFKNLLGAIHGYAELLQKDLALFPPVVSSAEPAISAHIGGIVKAAGRATTLVRQLLTFSRASITRAEHLDLNTVILDIKELITAFLRSGILLDMQLAPGPVMAYFDRNQIEQVVLNLAINARDAMPDGGRLTIGTAVLETGGARLGQFFVKDTGTGIPPEVQPKIFAPFFTTKAKNRGTGLGLPTCANIIKNARGHIRFETAPAQGTTFVVDLPDFPAEETAEDGADSHEPFFSVPETPPAAPASAAPARVPQDLAPQAAALDISDPDLPVGSETLLLVEDDPTIREITTAFLESLGYAVHAYATGDALLAAGIPAAQLLITDINMPGIGGRQLAERIRGMHPEIRVLYISGYINDPMRLNDAGFLEKPFTRDTLAQKVREALANET